jgi:hypothetical protein
MRSTALAISTAVLLVAGCSKPAPGSDIATAPPGSSGGPQSDRRAAAEPSKPSASNKGPAPVVATLAYAYTYAVEAPPRRIQDLVTRQQDICRAAGPDNCQVTGSTIRDHGKDDVSASLALRASPAWLAPFRPQIDRDVKAAGGRVDRENTQSEDLSRFVTDTEAGIRAKTALRDRLQTLLETHSGKISDLMEIESQLTAVQGDIDATQSELTAMRGRLQMSTLSIDYEPKASLAGRLELGALGRAVSGSVGLFVQALSLLVICIAALAPWAAVLAGAAWIARRLPRRRTVQPSKPAG